MQQENTESKNMIILEYKESLFTKIIKRIKSLCYKKRHKKHTKTTEK